jgi:serine/threonine protein phosphatase PrpC
MGCDGIFDKMSTEEVISETWRPLYLSSIENVVLPGAGTVNEICGSIAERLIKVSMLKESLDNLSVVVIGFKNFTKYIERLTV